MCEKAPRDLQNLSFIDGPLYISCVSTCLDCNLKPRVERAVFFYNPGIRKRYEYNSAQSCLWIFKKL